MSNLQVMCERKRKLEENQDRSGKPTKKHAKRGDSPIWEEGVGRQGFGMRGGKQKSSDSKTTKKRQKGSPGPGGVTRKVSTPNTGKGVGRRAGPGPFGKRKQKNQETHLGDPCVFREGRAMEKNFKGVGGSAGRRITSMHMER